MTRPLRLLATGLLAVALMLALVGAGGFSSTTADRGVTVATAADERAYVGYDSPDAIPIWTDDNAMNESEADWRETVTLVVLKNRFDVAIDVTGVEVAEKPDDLNVTVRSLPSDISPGGSKSGAIVADLECEDTFESEPLSVTVQIRGEDVEAVVFGDTQNRTISITCGVKS